MHRKRLEVWRENLPIALEMLASSILVLINIHADILLTIEGCA
jgi:hypothetical protein